MSAVPLTLRYRPHTFADLVGQNRSTAVLRAMVRKDRVPPVLIFGGTRGSGKTSAARILAAALNCKKRDSDSAEPCGSCVQCEGVWLTNSVSVLEIDAASSGGVEDVRKLRDLALYSHDGTYRVVLLDEAHGLSREAFNALLKTLEEPPPRTVFVMLTTEANKIPETIRSRAMSFEFRRIRSEEIIGRLTYVAKTEHLEVEPDLLSEIARQAKGGLRDAIMLLDQVRSIGISKGADFREWFGVAELGLELIKTCLSGDYAAVVECSAEAVARTGDASQLLTEAAEVLRDLVIIHAGGNPPCMPEQLEGRMALASSVKELSGLAEAMRVLWRASGQVRHEEDQVLAAQVIGVILSDALCPTARQPIPQSIAAVGAELSLDDMRGMAAALL